MKCALIQILSFYYILMSDDFTCQAKSAAIQCAHQAIIIESDQCLFCELVILKVQFRLKQVVAAPRPEQEVLT